jgi:hypothetical protein
MSFGSQKESLAFSLAPHQLENVRYSAQGSISPYALPPSNRPLVFDSVVYPAVDGQFLRYYNTPRIVGPASGSMGIYGRYRDFQSLEPNTPALSAGFPPMGRPFPHESPIDYQGKGPWRPL